jgi:hypothetical protein
MMTYSKFCIRPPSCTSAKQYKKIKKIKKNLYELHRGINKNRKEQWEKEHQLVIENKCCDNKNKNVEV